MKRADLPDVNVISAVLNVINVKLCPCHSLYFSGMEVA